MTNKKIRFHCDNKAVVYILNTMSSKSVRVLALLTMQGIFHNCVFKADHIPGSKNDVADALSRFQQERFRRLAPLADTAATPMPAYLWNIFNIELTNWYSQAFLKTRN
jgi:hypothetical protein